jgi:hypothetical protein
MPEPTLEHLRGLVTARLRNVTYAKNSVFLAECRLQDAQDEYAARKAAQTKSEGSKDDGEQTQDEA